MTFIDKRLQAGEETASVERVQRAIESCLRVLPDDMLGALPDVRFTASLGASREASARAAWVRAAKSARIFVFVEE